MRITTRLTEYSVTGGLLWLNLFLFATLLQLKQVNMHSAIDLWVKWLNDLQPLGAAMGSNLKEPLSTIFATLGIILIFLTGTLLDLLSSIFTPLEMPFFRRWLIGQNRPWLDHLIESHGDFINTDYVNFACSPILELGEWRHPLRFSLRWFKQWRRYNKLRAFMLSYLLMHAESAGLDELLDSTHLWRTSRALSTSLVVLGFLLNFTPLFNFPLSTAIYIAIVAPGILLVISVSITLGTYSRMSLMLCSLLYATVEKRSAEKSASEMNNNGVTY